MKNNNKGFSLIEMIIVIAIILILAALSTVTFYMANSKRPQKVMNTLSSYGKYAKSMAKAYDEKCCMAIIRTNDGDYYFVQGVLTADAKSDVDAKSNFRALKNDVTETTEAGSAKTSKTMKIVASDKKISDIVSDPSSVKNVAHGVGSQVIIKKDGVEITPNTPVIIQYSKFDGHAKFGSGKYEFVLKSSGETLCESELTKNTGRFRLIKQ